jgi:hypothetical protein
MMLYLDGIDAGLAQHRSGETQKCYEEEEAETKQIKACLDKSFELEIATLRPLTQAMNRRKWVEDDDLN